MSRPIAFRLGDATTRKLEELAELYGTKASAMRVAIDRLWQDAKRAQRAVPRERPARGDGHSAHRPYRIRPARGSLRAAG